MTLPGLDTLTHLNPEFASQAEHLGTTVWHATDRTPRETTAALLGCDLALGLLGLPFTMHITMARTLQVSDAFIMDVLVNLAPALGYPTVAQALVNLAPDDNGEPDPASADENTLARAAAAAVLGRPDPQTARISEIVDEYGTLRSAI